MSKDNNIDDLLKKAAEKRLNQEINDEGKAQEDAESQALAASLKSTEWIVKGVLVILVLFLLRSLFFVVPVQETAVVLRFGKPVVKGESILLEPGLHWRFPFPIDDIVTIKLSELQTVESSTGWWFMTEVEKTSYVAGTYIPTGEPSLIPGRDGYTITKDGNLIHLKAIMRYRVVDAEQFAFGFSSSTNLVQNILDGATYHASLRYDVGQALRTDRNALKETIASFVQKRIDEYDIGISLEQIVLETHAPLILREKFQATLNKSQDRSKMISEATGYAKKTTAQAKGEAASIVSAANAAKLRMVEGVKSEATQFELLYPKFQKNPDLFIDRVYLQNLAKVMKNSREKFIFKSGEDDKNQELRLQMNRKPVAPERVGRKY